MTDVSKLRVMVIDHGYFIWLAQRLARDVGQVYYNRIGWEDAQSKLDKRVVGDGFKDIASVGEPWKLIDEGKVDLVVFPDVHHSEMQAHIERCGIPVWGGREGDNLELKKLFWKKLQCELGMDCADYDVVRGVDGPEGLREYCRKETNRVIKLTPQFRGNQETFIHTDYGSSRGTIDAIAAHFESLQDDLVFIAEKKLESNIEGGIDTYCVDGQHPDMVVYGFEKKDKCYFATVKPYEEIPEEIRGPSDLLWPLLGKYRTRQFISSEVIVTEAKESHLIDNTIRLPSPAGEEQGELYKNLPLILYEGAQGRLVQPEIGPMFACEAMIEHTGDEERIRSLVVPDEEMRWVKLYNAFQSGKRICITPMDHPIIGAVVGIGETPEEALEHLKHNAESLKDQPVIIHTDALASVLIEIQESESKGMDFTDEPLPEPASVIED